MGTVFFICLIIFHSDCSHVWSCTPLKGLTVVPGEEHGSPIGKFQCPVLQDNACSEIGRSDFGKCTPKGICKKVYASVA